VFLCAALSLWFVSSLPACAATLCASLRLSVLAASLHVPLCPPCPCAINSSEPANHLCVPFRLSVFAANSSVPLPAAPVSVVHLFICKPAQHPPLISCLTTNSNNFLFFTKPSLSIANLNSTLPYNDKELILRLQKGNESAFSELYEQYAPMLIKFAAARLSSLEEARDIIHDLFVHFWQEREHIQVNVSLRAFLFAAVRYRIIDHIRKNSNHQKYANQVAALPAMELTTEEELYAKELQEKLHGAINQLSPRLQEIFKLSRFGHLTIAEIAQQLQLSEQTVKNQLSTALSQLRSKLATIFFILWW
jgi:RNA polymerase sigma-70 factor (family 1)